MLVHRVWQQFLEGMRQGGRLYFKPLLIMRDAIRAGFKSGKKAKKL
jgi:hypothetical protein